MIEIGWIGLMLATFGLGYGLGSRGARKDYEPIIDRLIKDLKEAVEREGENDASTARTQ